MTEAERKRAERARLRGTGLATCSVVIPATLVRLMRGLALVTSAAHVTGGGSTAAGSLSALLSDGLDHIDLDHPSLSETTRRALVALRNDLAGAAGQQASPPVNRAPPAERVTASGGAFGRRRSTPDGWLVPERSGKQPTASQARLAAAVAWHFDIEVPAVALDDRRVLSAWISLHVNAWKADGSPQPPVGHRGPPIVVGVAAGEAAEAPSAAATSC